jgi:3-keto-5-aminohexanoate cleavage enzyme
VTPEKQAAQTCDCYNAGASMVHIHARDPNNLSMPSNDVAVYRKVDVLIREKCPDIIINNTTSGGGPTIEGRLASIFAPAEVARLDMGPLVIRMALRDFEIDMVYPRNATFSETEKFAKAMLEKGVKPELEVWHTAQLWLVHNLIDKGLVRRPLFSGPKCSFSPMI